MPKRRLVNERIIISDSFNDLSIEAQAIFSRLLSVSDDYGVTYANPKKLNRQINTPVKLQAKIAGILHEFVEARMGQVFEYEGDLFFRFNPKTFEAEQWDRIRQRTQSEYLRLKKAQIEADSPFPEFPGNSQNFRENLSTQTESDLLKDRVIKPKELKLKEGKGSGEGESLVEAKPEEQPEKPRSKPRPQKPIEFFEDLIPTQLQALPEFVVQWRRWLTFRVKEHKARSAVTRSAAEEQLTMLSTQADPIAIIRQSIKNNWKGLFEISSSNGNGKSTSTKSSTQHDRATYEPDVQELARIDAIHSGESPGNGY